MLAGLVSVVGFGIDSGIESIAAILVGLRLAARLRHGHADERKERLALKLVAGTFFLLAAYVTIEGIRSLAGDDEPEHSWIAIGLLVASIIVMPVLAAAKKRVGQELNDNLILADAAETRICVLLSISTCWRRALRTDRRSLARPGSRLRHRRLRPLRGKEAWEANLPKPTITEQRRRGPTRWPWSMRAVHNKHR